MTKTVVVVVVAVRVEFCKREKTGKIIEVLFQEIEKQRNWIVTFIIGGRERKREKMWYSNMEGKASYGNVSVIINIEDE